MAAIRTESAYDPESWDVPFNLTVGAYVEEDTDENKTFLKNSQCIFVVTDKSPIYVGIVHTTPGMFAYHSRRDSAEIDFIR